MISLEVFNTIFNITEKNDKNINFSTAYFHLIRTIDRTEYIFAKKVKKDEVEEIKDKSGKR